MKNRCRQTLSVLLAALMLLSVFPAAGFAAGTEPAEAYAAADYDDAVRYVRERLIARDETILVDCPDDSFAENCFDSVCAYDPSEPFGGDYLKMSISDWRIESLTGDVFMIVPIYREGSGIENEAAVAAAVESILNGLAFTNQTSVDKKALAIYTWLCDNVYPIGADAAQHEQHSAYAALVPDGTGRRSAVCQGFAAAFYALALSAGLEARIILGTHDDGEELIPHAWNIVKTRYNQTIYGSWFADDVWQCLDAFAGSMYYKDKSKTAEADGRNAYFFKPLRNGYGGYAISYKEGFSSPEIADYKLNTNALSPYNIVTGSCGENVTYTLNLGNRTLTLEGTGDMTDYTLGAAEEVSYESGFLAPQDSMVLPPWLYYECEIIEIYLSEGITSVGDYAFMLQPELKRVSLPFSVTEIGSYAFAFAASLRNISIHRNVERIAPFAFLGCYSLKRIAIHSETCAIDDAGNVAAEDILEEKLTIPSTAGVFLSVCAENVIAYANQYHLSCHCDFNIDNICDDCGEYMSSCRETLCWTFDAQEGLLTICGSGYMDDQDIGIAPWYYLHEEIRKVIFEDKSESERITHVGHYAFYGCTALEEVCLSEGIKSLGCCAFCDSSLTTLTLPALTGASNTTYGPFLNSNITKIIFEAQTGETIRTAITKKICLNASNLKEVVVPNVSEIEEDAFQNCSSLTAISLPESLRKIGVRAFSNCSSLEIMIFPEALEQIDANAFGGCSALSSVYFLGSETSIADRAFDVTAKLVFHCSPGSTAEAYAQEKGITAHTDLLTRRENVTEATCAAEGSYDEVVACEDCGMELYRTKKTIPLADHVDENHDNVCDVCGEVGFCVHAYQTSRVEPTCTEKGAVIQTCEICGYSYTESELPVNDHDFSIVIDEVAATCIKDGVTAGRQCGVCGYMDGCDKIPAAGHQMEVTSPRRPAACTENGMNEVRTCSVCGHTEGGGEIPAKGHIDLDADGYCDECGKELEEGDFFRRTFNRILEWFFGTNGSGADAGSTGVIGRFVSILKRLVALLNNLGR